jgi:hypothetical protein
MLGTAGFYARFNLLIQAGRHTTTYTKAGLTTLFNRG